jgi:hypothetical protein
MLVFEGGGTLVTVPPAKKAKSKVSASMTNEEKEILSNREILENLELLENLDKIQFLELFSDKPEENKGKKVKKPDNKKDARKEK